MKKTYILFLIFAIACKKEATSTQAQPTSKPDYYTCQKDGIINIPNTQGVFSNDNLPDSMVVTTHTPSNAENNLPAGCDDFYIWPDGSLYFAASFGFTGTLQFFYAYEISGKLYQQSVFINVKDPKK